MNPSRWKEPIRRNVTCDRRIFEIVLVMGWSFGEVFYEGYQSFLSKLMKEGSNKLGMAISKAARLDIIIDDLELEIAELEKKRDILQHLKSTYDNFEVVHMDDKQSLAILFRDVAAKFLESGEIVAYHTAYESRVEHGGSTHSIILSIYESIKSRSNGSGASEVITTIKNQHDSMWESNMIWNTLVDLNKDPLVVVNNG